MEKMKLMPVQKFTLSYESLSSDCAQVRPQERGTREDLDEASARECLEAFVAIPAVDLVDLDATIRMRLQQKQVAVSRSGDNLYFTLIPEASHTPEPGTPESIIDYLADREASTEATPFEVAPEPECRPVKSRWQLPLGVQIALMIILGSLALGLGYHTLNKPAPKGYEFIANLTLTENLSRKIDGRYGFTDRADTLIFEIAGNTVTFFAVTKPDTSPLQVKKENFRFALRDGVVALIGANGDILEINPEGTLLFGETSYPRIVEP